jgi:hypothetical protein
MLAWAQPMHTTDATNIINTTKNIHNATLPGQTVVYRGIISSEKPVHLILPPGLAPHGATILPQRPDDATYAGTLTFTATKPVEVGFGHRLHLDNSTLAQLGAETLNNLLLSRHIKSPTHATPGIISIPSVIVPDYGSSPPYFSASIPFVASSVILSTNGEPFIVAYEVSADILQPKLIKHHENATISPTTTTNSTT